MPRNRKDASLSWLPNRVYIQRDRYVYQPKGGGKKTLCKVSEGKLKCLKRYEQEYELAHNKNQFKFVVDSFLKSPEFKRLSFRTQKDYQSYCVLLRNAFGSMKPDSIKPPHVRKFQYKLAEAKKQGNKPANATANRHKACLQKICTWAVAVGKMKINPCVGVTKLPEQSRTRYITDSEYQAIYDNAPKSCQIAMELSYLCMARISDVIDLKVSDIHSEGLYIKQGKTGVAQIKLWSQRLIKAVSEAKALPCKEGMFTMFLFNKPDGSRYTVRAIQAQYNKACKKANVQGVTLHDLKSKAISDFEGTLADKSDAAGHTNLNMTKRYDRKIKHVRSVK